MKSPILMAVVAAVLVTVVSVAGQMPQVPGAPQQPGAASAGPPQTTVIFGQVIDAATGQPVPEVTVSVAVRAPAGRAGGAGNRVDVLTGTDGKFVVRDVPVGNAQISTMAPGYVNGGYGQAHPGAAPQPYTIPAGAKVVDVKIRVWKTASITGVVVDERGEPRPGITVRAMRRSFVRGQPRLSVQGMAIFSQSDDRGVYRISGLIPGDYVVVSPQTQMSMVASTMEAAMKGAASGDMAALISAGMDFATGGGAMLGGGVRIGDLMVGTQEGLMPIPQADGRWRVYSTRFHPGVDVPSQATVLSLRSGEERTGIDLNLALVPTVSVSGVVTGPNGPVSGVGVRLRHVNEPLVSDQSADVAVATTRADGSFMMPTVPVGTYVIRVLRAPRVGPTAAQLAELSAEIKAMMGALAQPNANDATMLFVEQPLTLERDVAGLTLMLSTGATLSGRLAFEGVAEVPASPGVQVTLTAIGGDWAGTPAMGATASGRVNPDGTFVTTGYPPGRYVITVGGRAVPNWFVKSATVNGRDALYEAFELEGRDLSDVVVTLTDKRTTLSGTVQASSTAAGAAAAVVIFPAAWREWIAGGMSQQLVRITRTPPTGVFSITGMPPREYLIVAVETNDTPDLQDPAAFEALARLATTVTMGDGETRTMTLKVTQVVR